MTFEEAQKIWQACLVHAEELLIAADNLLARQPYLAYHFSTLALEEVGKALQVGFTVLPARDKKPPFSDIDDHTQKLFWALWNPVNSRETLTLEHMNQCRELSKQIHHTRLQGLYVDYTNNTLSIPKETVSTDKATTLLDLAKKRLEIAKLHQVPNLDDEAKSLLQWIFRVLEDDNNAKFIFSRASMDKLAESQNTAVWFRWIKEQFDKNEQETRDILKREMERTEPQGDERFNPKWQIKIRLLTSSHSIRQTELNWVNGMGEYWNFQKGKDNSELLVTSALPSGIPIQGLWPVALSECRRLAAALNIASFGLFWWQIPIDVSKFYLKIIDVENKCEVKVERRPTLTLDWGPRVLDRDILFNMLLANRFLPRLQEGKEVEMIGKYLRGVAVLGKNDIHLRMEATALIEFYEAFRAAMRHYGDWDGQISFEIAAKAMFERDFKDWTDWPETLSLAEGLSSGNPPTTEITLTHVIMMKLCCDGYITKNLKKLAEIEKSQTQIEDKDGATDSKGSPTTEAYSSPLLASSKIASDKFDESREFHKS